MGGLVEDIERSVMPFSIDEFKANLNGMGGLARPSHYQVLIPAIVQSGVSSEELALTCEQAILPGINLMTNEFRYTGYGVTEKRPYMPSFNDATLVFIADGDSKVYSFFQTWLRYVNEFNEDQETGTTSTFRYPNEYVTDIQIEQYRNDGELIQTYTLFRAFPVTLGEATVGWNERNNYIRIPVQLAYNNWTSDGITQ